MNAPSPCSRSRSAGKPKAPAASRSRPTPTTRSTSKELDRFFYRDHWCYVGLEAEIPNPGDFKRTVIGERSVIMVRDNDGAHPRRRERLRAPRHARSAASATATARSFTCPYHQWNYTLAGDLQGVPFRRGVKQDGKVNGGMPADFKTTDHGLTKLKVATRGGVVFASFDHDVESLEDYLGPDDPRLLRPPLQRPQAEDPRLQPPAHPGQLEADAGEHQGPVPPRAAAHLVRHLRALARRQQVAAADGRAPSPRGDGLHPRRGGQGRAGHAGVELQGEHAAQRPALPRHRARALVGRADRGDDDDLPERDPAAAGQQRLDAAHPARRPRRVRLRLDALRLRRRQRGDDPAPAAPGQPVRPGRLRLGRRRRGDRVLAAGLREQAVPPHAGRARRPRGGRHRPHGHRDADPRHVRVLARGDGGD